MADMETTGTKRTKDGCCEFGLPVLQRQVFLSTPLKSPDSCTNSSFRKIDDETLMYMSTIFDETMDPSLITNGIVPTADVQLKKMSNAEGKANRNSLPCIPEENGQAEFSKSFTSPQNDHKELTQTNSKTCQHELSSPWTDTNIGNEMMVESNGTFDVSKGLKEESFGLDSTKVLNCERAEPNITFEKSKEFIERCSSEHNSTASDNASLQGEYEKQLNSTVDVYGRSDVTTQQQIEKVDSTEDITHSNVSKQEQCNEELLSSEEHEKHGTFTKSTKQISVNIDLTGVVEQNGIASLHMSTELSESGSAKVHTSERTFNKHDTLTDLTHPRPLPTVNNSNINTTKEVLRISNIESPTQSSPDVGAAVGDALLSGPLDALSTVAVPSVNVEVAVCSNTTQDLPEGEDKMEDQQGHFQRRNGVSDGECYPNLNISHCSIFSLDDTLDMKSRALVTSTPVVLGRGFDRLGSAKFPDMQKRLSVINSIETQSTDDLVGTSEHDGFDTAETIPPSIKSDTQKVLTKCTSVAMSAAVNKPPSKLAVRRKIPQPAFRTNIPKTQLPPKPPTSQETEVVNPKGVPTTRALNQPETSETSMHTLKRTVQLNKKKNFGPAKSTMTTGTARLSAMTTSSGCNFTADSKPSNSCMTKPKPSNLATSGQRRLGLKPPGSATFSVETGHSKINPKPSGLTGIRTRSLLLPGLAQKHASSDVLPLAKRKKTDMQYQPTCAEAPTGSNPRDKRIKRPSTGCVNCTLIQEKLCTFHQELGEFLQECRRIPAGCEKLGPFQQKFELCLEEFRRLQAAHQ